MKPAVMPSVEEPMQPTLSEWAAEIRDPSSVAEQSKDLSEDYTEFRPEYPARLEGKDVYTRINTAGATGSSRTI